MKIDEALAWARAHVSRLGQNALDNGPIAATVDFLEAHAGRRSAFTERARIGLQREAKFGGARIAAEALTAWIEYAEAGFVGSGTPEVQARVTAANDLMEQVGALLAQAQVHPAAPAVLAGAALEEFLRSLMVANEVATPARPSLATYATALQKIGVLTQQDVKDVTAWAGMRNAAAHGRFEEIQVDRVRLMADAINLFMRQKA